MTKFIQGLILVFISLSAFTEDMTLRPQGSALEIFQCNFANGKDLNDTLKVAAKWDAWADENGQPFVMHCFPITCYDINELQKKHPKFLENTTVAAMVDLIVMKAASADGEKLFKAAEDRIDLMGEETAVISSIAEQMFAEIQSAEDAEKNS